MIRFITFITCLALLFALAYADDEECYCETDEGMPEVDDCYCNDDVRSQNRNEWSDRTIKWTTDKKFLCGADSGFSSELTTTNLCPGFHPSYPVCHLFAALGTKPYCAKYTQV